MSVKSMICIVCPVGCHVSIDDNHTVTGNRCKRGETYAIKEVTNPTRMITSTVKIKSNLTTRLSVKTSEPIAKTLIFEVMDALNSVEMQAPVSTDDVVIKNVLDTGIDILATRTILE